jgi:hypothetical protein
MIWMTTARRLERPGSGQSPVYLLVLLGLLLGGCAEAPLASPQTPAGPRAAADDGDLWNLAPSNADALADVDLAALRASPWSRALTSTGLAGDRDESRRIFGYDLFAEGERLVAVGTEAAGAQRSLSIVRGRFDPARIGAAFLAATPGATAGHWRDSPLWEGRGRAVALVTPRTLAQGDPESVRGAIDAAWGIVPDASTGPLGVLRRALGADGKVPAVFVALSLTDAMRGRAAGTIELPPGLTTAAGRLDLGDDLNLDLVAVLGNGSDATAAAATWNLALRALAQQPMLRLLGLGPIIDGLSLGAEGARVHGHLRVPAERREGLADKLLAVLQMVAGAAQGSRDK